MTIKEAVAIAFSSTGEKDLHVNQIAQHLKNSIADYKEIEVNEIQKKVNSFLAANIKSKTGQNYKKAINPKTKKPRKGIYCIYLPKKEPSTIIVDKPQPQTHTLTIEKQRGKKRVDSARQTINQPEAFSGIGRNTNKLYFGKAGEYAAVSELLFREYSASIMSVDEGIDITASKHDKFYFIQVKSTWFTDNKITVSIKPNNFVNNTNANIFYIIVFRYLTNKAYTNRYIVINSTDMERLISQDKISCPNGSISIKIRMINGSLEFYNGNNTENVDYYLDNFDLIK